MTKVSLSRGLLMKIDGPKPIFSFLVLIFVTGISGAVDVRPQNSGSRNPNSNAPETAASGSTAKLTRLEKTRKSVNLSRAFLTGVLPPPSQLPAGGPDEQAFALARELAGGDENSTAALHRAILAAGFALRNLDKTITRPVGSGQGLVFEAGEIAAMAKMYGEERDAPIAEVGLLIASVFPKINRDRVANLLLEDIKRHAQDGGNPRLRFWASFIVELGRQRGTDLLTLKDASGLRIDPIQHGLIIRRLIGDFVADGGKINGANTAGEMFTTPQYTPFSISEQRSWTATFGKATYTFLAPFLMVAAYTPTPFSTNSVSLQRAVPCRLDGDAGTIMDGGALVISIGFGRVLGHLEENLGKRAGDALGKYGNLASAANALLVYIKFIQSYAALETVIEMEGTGPLIRTRNAIPGARRNFIATTRMNIGKWQTFNCVRLALVATTGIDFNTMNDGPVKGAVITWHLDQGGAGDAYSNSTGLTGNEQIVDIVNSGPRIQDKGAYAGIAGTSGKPVSNATQTVTDGKGQAKITVEGSPQKNHKMGNVAPVIKPARLRTNIQLKGGDIKGDVVDALSQAAGGVSGIITMPAELLYRTDWASTAHYQFEVQDWDESGEISIQYVYTGIRFTELLPADALEDCPNMRLNGQEVLTARLRLIGTQVVGAAAATLYEGTGRFSADIDGCGRTPDPKTGDPELTDSMLGCKLTIVAPERPVNVRLGVASPDTPGGGFTLQWAAAGPALDPRVTTACDSKRNAWYVSEATQDFRRSQRTVEVEGGSIKAGTSTYTDDATWGKWRLTVTKVESHGTKKD